jgi:microcystin-dependent protein
MTEFLTKAFNPDGTIKSSAVWRSGSVRWVSYPDITDDLNDGWILPDGAVYAVTTYPGLAKRYGKLYGGDGALTFGVPNIADRVVLGFGATATLGTAVGAMGGSINQTYSISGATTPTNTQDAGGFSAGVTGDGGDFSAGVTDSGNMTATSHTTDMTGAGTTFLAVDDPSHEHSTPGQSAHHHSSPGQADHHHPIPALSFAGTSGAGNQAYIVFKALIKT